MQIPLSDAKIPEWVMLNCLLPEGFAAREHGGKYYISDNIYIVATAVVEDGMVRFDILPGARGEEFKKKLYAIHPEHDPDRLYWVIYYEWYGAYAFVGHGLGHETAEDALSYLLDFHLDRNPILCQVRLSEIFSDTGRGDELTTVSTFPIGPDLTLSADTGPRKICITHLEVGHE